MSEATCPTLYSEVPEDERMEYEYERQQERRVCSECGCRKHRQGCPEAIGEQEEEHEV